MTDMRERLPIFEPSEDSEFDRFQQDLYRGFCRHLVCIILTVEQDGVRQDILFSGFVIDIKGHYVVATAGHCLKDFETDLNAGRFKLVKGTISDFFSDDAKVFRSHPFPIDSFACRPVDEPELGLDFGFIFLPELLKKNLVANGIVTISEENWTGQNLDACQDFCLLGCPKDIYDQGTSGNKRKYAALLAGVDRITDFSELAPEIQNRVSSKKFPLFVGRLRKQEGYKVFGMSGGPIFGYRWQDGEPHYWIVAIQSGWFETSRIIFGSHLLHVGSILMDGIRQANPHLFGPTVGSESSA